MTTRERARTERIIQTHALTWMWAPHIKTSGFNSILFRIELAFCVHRPHCWFSSAICSFCFLLFYIAPLIRSLFGRLTLSHRWCELSHTPALWIYSPSLFGSCRPPSCTYIYSYDGSNHNPELCLIVARCARTKRCACQIIIVVLMRARKDTTHKQWINHILEVVRLFLASGQRAQCEWPSYQLPASRHRREYRIWSRR